MIVIKVNKAFYSKEILLKTAYSLTDKVYLHLDQDENSWIVSWIPKNGQVIDSEEFENELITQALREKLINQTADLRRIILARAFASTIMDNQQVDNDVPVTDEIDKQDSPSLSEKEKAEILRGWFDQP